jgi:hypothetical protein
MWLTCWVNRAVVVKLGGSVCISRNHRNCGCGNTTQQLV